MAVVELRREAVGGDDFRGWVAVWGGVIVERDAILFKHWGLEACQRNATSSLFVGGNALERKPNRICCKSPLASFNCIC